MAHTLENLDPDTGTNATDKIENEITHLICRMSDYQALRFDPIGNKIIEDWRHELVVIRAAVGKLGPHLQDSH